MPENNFTMVVLAGGASSRMGQEKSDLLFGRQTFLETQIEKGRKLGARQILISGYRGTHCGEEIVPDRIPGQGPLGGLEELLSKGRDRKMSGAWCRYATGAIRGTAQASALCYGRNG